MAIKYNPYNWEIRPNKETIEGLENEREKILGEIFIHLCCNDKFLINYWIFKLQNIQSQLEKAYIENGQQELCNYNL